MMRYVDGQEVKVGDEIRRLPTVSYPGETGIVVHVEDNKVVTDFPGHNCGTHRISDGRVVDAWGNDNDDFTTHWAFVRRGDGRALKAPKPAPAPFNVKGHAPKLVLKLGCKEFELGGFKKRALKVRRLLSQPPSPDASVTVMGESGLTPADIDGLLAWLEQELKRA